MTVIIQERMWFSIICSLLSALGGVSVLFHSIYKNSYKKEKTHISPCVFNICAADFIRCIGNLLSIGTLFGDADYLQGSICQIQAFCKNIQITSYFFICYISIIMCIVLINHNQTIKENRSIRISIWICSISICIIPLLYPSKHGVNGYDLMIDSHLCWIPQNFPELRMAIYYVWLFISLIWLTLVGLISFCILTFKDTNLERAVKRFLQIVAFYGLIMLIFWSFASVRRIYQWYGYKHLSGKYDDIIQNITTDSYGAINSAVYWYLYYRFSSYINDHQRRSSNNNYEISDHETNANMETATTRDETTETNDQTASMQPDSTPIHSGFPHHSDSKTMNEMIKLKR